MDTPAPDHMNRTPTSEHHDAFEILGGDAASGVVVLCDHASNTLPARYGTLGLGADQLARHIAYDIGADGVSRHLAATFASPCVLSRFSRLLIDANRGLDDPTLIMRVSDGAVIPGNRVLPESERQARIEQFYAPYHDAVRRTVDAACGDGRLPVLVSIHSFTPVWRGVPRPWEVGVLWDQDPRLAVPLIAAMRGDNALTVGDNEPYHGALRGDTLWQHGTSRGIAHALIEVRQDLIATPEGQRVWAEKIAAWLRTVLDVPGYHSVLNETRYFGSSSAG
jgi:predicted N-formylglutamate amidohydrolase